MLPSLTVVVVSRKGIFVFDTSCVNFIDGMGNIEERLLLSSLRQPLSWFRFIDDVDMKWTHGDKELDEFLEHGNSIHPSIKFTHEVSKTKTILVPIAVPFI
jgi:hypothetical protein